MKFFIAFIIVWICGFLGMFFIPTNTEAFFGLTLVLSFYIALGYGFKEILDHYLK